MTHDAQELITDYPTALRSHVIGLYYGRGDRLPLFLMLEVMDLMTVRQDNEIDAWISAFVEQQEVLNERP